MFAFHRAENDNEGPSKITHLSESKQPKEDHSGVLVSNELSQEQLVEKLVKENKWRFVSGSLDFFRELFRFGLVLYQYKFDNTQLSLDMNQLIQDGIFVEAHREKWGKLSWLGSGGPSFYERTSRMLFRHDSFLKLLKTHSLMFRQGKITKPFVIAYESSIEY